MKTMTATQAKSKFLEVLRKAHDSGEVFSITNNGIPYAVIMGQDDYEGLLETLLILEDKDYGRELLKRGREAKKGKGVSFEKVFGTPQQK
ncbi:MAG: type II toxin-antitoxin system Phd/YefM family antitoxin [Candidatus Omnitrophica bacterium]|nr:type II toxin-antitoxin system Phd/YefM family antitoxin [Candidatus Omnitrophota bacterium]